MKKAYFFTSILLAAAVSCCFTYHKSTQDWLIWTNKCLMQSYNASLDPKLKRFDFSVTADGFVRLRKIYAKEREEFFSFNLHQFDHLDYLGNTITGTLVLRTMADDIIVQTKNDRKGDLDSMSTVLNVPVKNMEPERLDSLEEALNYFKGKGL